MWDTKRQVVWLVCGVAFGTFVMYQQSVDETGRVGLKYFAVLETLLLVVIAVMFYVYSKKP